MCGISGSNAGYTVFRGSVKSTGYPLVSRVSPSLPQPVRHRLPSHFNWTLLNHDRESEKQVYRGWSQVHFVKGGVATGHVKKVYEAGEGYVLSSDSNFLAPELFFF